MIYIYGLCGMYKGLNNNFMEDFMGIWKCNDGTEVEMIFNNDGDFEKFGEGVTDENADKAKKEIYESMKNL